MGLEFNEETISKSRGKDGEKSTSGASPQASNRGRPGHARVASWFVSRELQLLQVKRLHFKNANFDEVYIISPC